MTAEPGTVAEVFDKPHGPLRIGTSGRWWANRRHIDLDDDHTITVVFSDGRHVAEITGTPYHAHVSSAVVNTPVDRLPAGGPLACHEKGPHAPHQWAAFGTAVNCGGVS